MNAYASELGLSNTLFQNAVGWTDPNHFSSAKDLANITKVMINNFPDHERVPVSLYKLGLISIKLEKNEEAIAFFERVILNYPESGSSILSEQELLKFKS